MNRNSYNLKEYINSKLKNKIQNFSLYITGETELTIICKSVIILKKQIKKDGNYNSEKTETIRL